MNNFTVRVSVPRLSSIAKRLGVKFTDEDMVLAVQVFADYVLRIYLDMIREGIQSTRYKGEWEPDSSEYEEYLGTKPVRDIYSLIVEEMTVQKTGYSYTIRINPYTRYPKSRRYLITVLSAIEYGTSKFRARPLLRSISNTLNKSINDLWRGFLTMKGVV